MKGKLSLQKPCMVKGCKQFGYYSTIAGGHVCDKHRRQVIYKKLGYKVIIVAGVLCAVGFFLLL